MVVWEGTRPLLVEIRGAGRSLDDVQPAPRCGGAGTEPSGDPAGGAAPSRRPTDGRSGRLRQCGRRGEGHGNQRRPRRCCWRWSPACATVLCRRIWWSLAKWGWLGKFARYRAVRSVSPKRRSTAFAAPSSRRPMCRKSAGRHANLWREKAFRRAKRFDDL